MTDHAWRTSLQVGEKVIVKKDGIGRMRAIGTVTRRVSTRVVVRAHDLEWSFMVASGHEVGGDTWHAVWLVPYTEEDAATIHLDAWHRKLAQWARHAETPTFRCLDLAQCQDLWNILVTLGLTTPKEPTL